MQDEKIEIYIGDVLLSTGGPDLRNPSARAGQVVDEATVKLASLGGTIANLFAAMRPEPRIFEESAGAESYEVEIGFSVEIGAGGALKLFLSPKIGMSCKAKMQWKRSSSIGQ